MKVERARLLGSTMAPSSDNLDLIGRLREQAGRLQATHPRTAALLAEAALALELDLGDQDRARGHAGAVSHERER